MIRIKGRRDIPKSLMSFGRHLVYAEGTKTEPLYVDDLRALISEKLNVDKRSIEIVPVKLAKTKHTCELVEYAHNDVLSRLRKGESIDYVWIFYDKDCFEDFDKAYLMIKNLDSNYKGGISWIPCWSNECFEVWVYHYYEKLTTPLPREEYINKINNFLKSKGCKEKYSKTRTDLHHFLTLNGGDINKAIKWMKEADNGKDKKPNPSSGVYQFAEYIIAYLKNVKGSTPWN